MIINTVDELKQRIGKFVVLSQYSQNFDDSSTSMKLLTRVEDGWLRHFDAVARECEKSPIFGYEIEGKLSGKMHPFMPYARDINGTTFSNTYMYVRDPTEQEIKEFMQHWRLYIYNTKIKPKQIYHFLYPPSKENYELPF